MILKFINQKIMTTYGKQLFSDMFLDTINLRLDRTLKSVNDDKWVENVRQWYLFKSDPLYKHFEDGKITCIDYMELNDWLENTVKLLYKEVM